MLVGQIWNSSEEAPETQVQIVEKDRAQTPFLAYEAKQSLGLEFPEDWEIYSLQDADAFVGSIPQITLMLVLFLLPIVLLTGSCILKSKKALWCNLGLSAASFGGAWAMLSAVELPVSWLPPDNVFRISHYRGQMAEILRALEQLGDTKMQLAWEQACKNANWIMLGAGILSLVIVIAEIIVFKKKRQ